MKLRSKASDAKAAQEDSVTEAQIARKGQAGRRLDGEFESERRLNRGAQGHLRMLAR